MSMVLEMLAFNVPLSQWRTYVPRKSGAGFFGSKNTDKVAQSIFSQLSHESAIELVAKEFDTFPADLRLRLRTLCNAGNGSGNVRKGYSGWIGSWAASCCARKHSPSGSSNGHGTAGSRGRLIRPWQARRGNTGSSNYEMHYDYLYDQLGIQG